MNQQQQRAHVLTRQVTRLDRRLAALGQAANRLAWVRLGAFIAWIGLTGVVWAQWGALTMLLPGVLGLVGFILAVRAHARVKRSIARHRAWQTLKQTHLARLHLDWENLPPALFTAARTDQPLERDLDLAGARGLHHLLDTAATREGSARLRNWLATETPDPAEIHARQALVRELVPLTLFRDRLALHAPQSARRRRWSSQRLDEWLTAESGPALWSRALGLTGLSLLTGVLLLLNALADAPPLWRGTFVVYILAYLWHVFSLGDPFAMALALRDPLDELRAVFDYLERYGYPRQPALRILCAPFRAAEDRPSQHLARVSRLLAAGSVRRNPPLWMLLSALVPWDLFVMHELNRSRAKLADLLPRWLDVWFELEALGALANFAYLNPAYAWPDLRADADTDTSTDPQPLLEGETMGHPLIPASERVCNSFTLSTPGDLALITGSNMSGKSTFLRTVGINLCLAYAGGPVCAGALRTAPLRLVTCIRVTDSVTDGISYFYAEVKCLKRLLDALDAEHAFPACFLIDEIFRGTNNRERLIGSQAYIHALVARRGIGVLSTHDLELVSLADSAPQITNYHFAEHIAEGRMSFDYTLRSGPCPTTNALQIMQMEGLPIDVGN